MAGSRDVLTIIICCYNGSAFIDECLGSLIKQTVKDAFRVLFVNDGSTDDSLKKARGMARGIKNINFIENSHAQGLVKSCNKALGLVDTPYFVRLDADDYFSADAVKDIYEELNTAREKDFIIFKRWDISAGGIEEVRYEDDMYTWIAAGTVFKTEPVKAAGGYSNEYWEEFDLYIKLLEAGCRQMVSARRTYYYRRTHSSMTKDPEKNLRGFETLLKKWGIGTLQKYGDIKKAMSYYGVGA